MTARDWTAIREALLAADVAAYNAGDKSALGNAGRTMNAIRRVLIIDALPEFDASSDAFCEATAGMSVKPQTVEPAAREVA